MTVNPIMTGVSIGCNLQFQTGGMSLDLLVDYGDTQTTTFYSLTNVVSMPLNKSYANPGTYFIVMVDPKYNAKLNYSITILGGLCAFL